MSRSDRYGAFVSYRHTDPDRQRAKWLHTGLETYRVPKPLVAAGCCSGRSGPNAFAAKHAGG